MKKLVLVLALVALALPMLAPTDAQALDPYAECMQCMEDCQAFQEPTYSQCVAWCYRTIPACNW